MRLAGINLSVRDLLEQLRTRHLLRRLVGNTAWQMSDKVLRLVFGLLVSTLMARHLGPENFGLFNFAIAFVALFSFLADGGLPAVVVRELVRRPESRVRIVSSAMALRFLGAVLATISAFGAILLLRRGDMDSVVVVLIVAAGLLPQAWDAIDFDFQARMHARPIVLIRSCSLIVFAMVKLGLIVGGAGLRPFAWTVLGEAALSAVLMSRVFHKEVPAFGFKHASGDEMRTLLGHSWPLAISSLSVMLYMRIDQVMLGQLMDDRAVGVFSAAVRLSESWYFIPMAVLSAVAPALTAAHAGSQAGYERRLVFLMRAMIYFGIFVAIAFTVVAHPLIALLYGDQYSEAAAVLTLHAWAGVFASLGVAAGPWFVNAGTVQLKMIYTLAGAFANIALNLYMIPAFGPMGAAVSTLVSYSLAALWLNAFNSRTRPIFRMQAKSFFFT